MKKTDREVVRREKSVRKGGTHILDGWIAPNRKGHPRKSSGSAASYLGCGDGIKLVGGELSIKGNYGKQEGGDRELRRGDGEA